MGPSENAASGFSGDTRRDEADDSRPSFIQIVPGVWFASEHLRTIEGRAEAQLLRAHRQRFHLGRKYEGEPLKARFKLGSCAELEAVLDADSTARAVATQLARQLPPSASRPTVRGFLELPAFMSEVITDVLRRKFYRDTITFFRWFVEDVYFEVLLALDGSAYLARRGLVRSKRRRRAAQLAVELRRDKFPREGIFPTHYLLWRALTEAFEKITGGDSRRGLRQEEVVEFFSTDSRYATCGDTSTLRYWLRRHGLPRWNLLVKRLGEQQTSLPWEAGK